MDVLLFVATFMFLHLYITIKPVYLQYKRNKTGTVKMMVAGAVYFIIMLFWFVRPLFDPSYIRDLHGLFIPPIVMALLISMVYFIRGRYLGFIFTGLEFLFFVNETHDIIKNLKQDDVGAAGWAGVLFNVLIFFITCMIQIIDFFVHDRLGNRVKMAINEEQR